MRTIGEINMFFFFLGLRLLGPIDVAKLHTTTHILQLFAAVAAPARG